MMHDYSIICNSDALIFNYLIFLVFLYSEALFYLKFANNLRVMCSQKSSY